MAGEERANELGEEPRGRRRAWARGFAVAFLLLQVSIPLRYYLGDDAYDERFSWRMFSAVRVIRCRTAVQESFGEERTWRRVPLMMTIHEAWVETLRRNREEVIRAFLARRCEEADVHQVVLENRCIDTTRRPLPSARWERDCARGEVTPPGGAGDPS